MLRIAMGIEYDGSGFHGWQSQKSVSSVQSALETALSRVAHQPCHTVCAGRTDRGVHGLGQVIHFDTTANRESNAWVLGTNTYLNRAIRVLWAKEVGLEFNARRSALSRHYRYIIYNHPIRPSLFRQHLSWYYKPLEIERMREASNYWLGEHDFSSFRAADCQSHSPVREVYSLTIEREGDCVLIDITANAFLHHMVRNMVGVLKKIGAGLADPIFAQKVLLARDRRQACKTAAASGLYLVEVHYPESFELPWVPGTCLAPSLRGNILL